ncbi:hypothetical protein HanPI659440_Chr16g0638821 [Helianthus annuus]|nr:hypothetical protein HanPI659440_Chr16g0638821 [Helianthus annuus]
MSLSSSRGLTDPLTEDESMSLSSSRGWPSSAYFIQGYILGAGKSYYAATLLGLIAHMSFFFQVKKIPCKHPSLFSD